jgi:coatomer protein complex subunit gamma
VQLPEVAGSSTAYAYVAFAKEAGAMPLGPIGTAFRFAVREDGDDTFDDPDDYPIEPVELSVSDYIAPLNLGGEFDRQWEQLTSSGSSEATESRALPGVANLTEAARTIVDFYQMAVEGGAPDKITTKSHTLKMSGYVMSEKPLLVLATAKVFITSGNEIGLTLTMRGQASEDLLAFLASSLFD